MAFLNKSSRGEGGGGGGGDKITILPCKIMSPPYRIL